MVVIQLKMMLHERAFAWAESAIDPGIESASRRANEKLAGIKVGSLAAHSFGSL
jgi:hypothetical protein